MKKQLSRVAAFLIAVLTLTLFVSAAEVPVELVNETNNSRAISTLYMCYKCKKTTVGNFYCSGLMSPEEFDYSERYDVCDISSHSNSCLLMWSFNTTAYACDTCGAYVYMDGRVNPYYLPGDNINTLYYVAVLSHKEASSHTLYSSPVNDVCDYD